MISDEQGRLLMLEQAAEFKRGLWGPPAGGLEAHETVLNAAVREAREETGLGVELVDLVGIYTADKGSTNTGMSFVFRARAVSGTITLPPEEILSAKYFTQAEIAALAEKKLLYRPEYNLPCYVDWTLGRSFLLELVRPLT
jgi:ADP-ribose pyrophosphatase YjhB (NUDIX family)